MSDEEAYRSEDAAYRVDEVALAAMLPVANGSHEHRWRGDLKAPGFDDEHATYGISCQCGMHARARLGRHGWEMVTTPVQLPAKASRPQGRRSGSSPSKSKRDRVIERDGSICRYCGGLVRLGDVGRWMLTLDHITPRSRGGTNEVDNLVVACRVCNTAKADRTVEEAGMVLLPPGGLAAADSTACPDCADGLRASAEGTVQCASCGGVGVLSAERAVYLFTHERSKARGLALSADRARAEMRRAYRLVEDRYGQGAYRANLATSVASLRDAVARMERRILTLKVELAEATGADLAVMIPHPRQVERALRFHEEDRMLRADAD